MCTLYGTVKRLSRDKIVWVQASFGNAGRAQGHPPDENLVGSLGRYLGIGAPWSLPGVDLSPSYLRGMQGFFSIIVIVDAESLEQEKQI